MACILTVSLAGCLGGDAQPAATAAPARLPLDPLSEDERGLAATLALADARVQELLGGERHRLIGTALHVDKERTPQGARLVDVWFYRYGSNDVVWPLVELTQLRVERVDVQTYQPVLVKEELLEAEAVLFAHPDVLARVGAPAGLHTMSHLYRADEGPCATHRCTEVVFVRGDEMLSARAIFDLSTMEVVRVWDMDAGSTEVSEG